MHTFFITLIFALTVLNPVKVFAQLNEDGLGDEVNGAAVPIHSAEEPPEAAQGVQHTVEPGDTLWDLSQHYLGSPWYWPKVWSYNKAIANPHWIYPGNLVRFYATGEEVPTRVEVQGGESADADDAVAADDASMVRESVDFRFKSHVDLLTPGFITSQEVEETGQIVGSFGEAEQLHFPVPVYLTFTKDGAAKVGERYLVLRNMGQVLHPVTKESVGVYTRVTGQVEVTGLTEQKGIVRAMIVRQSDAILRGDLIGPSGEEMMRRVEAIPNERDINGGIVIAAPNPALTMYAENQLAIIDRGSTAGVKPGNVFTVWRQNDSLAQDHLINPSRIAEGWPREDIGQCIAFEVKQKVSICLVMRSIRAFVSGDRADVRAHVPTSQVGLRSEPSLIAP